MKGVILAGGNGARLYPLTKVTNKHLLPVYNKPMIYYPLNTLIKSGIKDIMIVSGRGHAGHFLELLGSGNEFDCNLSYAVQDKAGGIAHALNLTKDFVDKDNVVCILGDNIFQQNNYLTDKIKNFRGGAKIFLKKVESPERFGVAKFENESKLIEIIEKPNIFISSYAVTGLYIYDNTVFDIISYLKPSSRGELEITDVNNSYIKENKIDFEIINGFWSDAGTFESLYNASSFIRENTGED